MAKSRKTKKYNCQVINIKLQSDKEEGDERTEAYENLISALVDGKIRGSVNEEKAMMVYSRFDQELPSSKIKYIHGLIGKGVYFDSQTIPVFNIDESSQSQEESDKNKILNPKTTPYIFIPSIHRLAFITNRGISMGDMIKFFEKALLKVKDKEDKIVIEIEKDPNITDELFNAFAVHSIEYRVTYSNQDSMSNLGSAFDNRLKRSHIGEITVKAKADFTGSMNFNDEELLAGGAEVAQSNGEIKSAVITSTEGEKKKTLSNEEKPLIINYEADNDSVIVTMANKVWNFFR